jgi:hypothetical protein
MCGFAAKQAAVAIDDRATDRTAIRVLIMRRFRQKGRSGSIAKITIFSAGKNGADTCEQLEADTLKVLASAATPRRLNQKDGVSEDRLQKRFITMNLKIIGTDWPPRLAQREGSMQ